MQSKSAALQMPLLAEVKGVPAPTQCICIALVHQSSGTTLSAIDAAALCARRPTAPSDQRQFRPVEEIGAIDLSSLSGASDGDPGAGPSDQAPPGHISRPIQKRQRRKRSAAAAPLSPASQPEGPAEQVGLKSDEVSPYPFFLLSLSEHFKSTPHFECHPILASPSWFASTSDSSQLLLLLQLICCAMHEAQWRSRMHRPPEMSQDDD